MDTRHEVFNQPEPLAGYNLCEGIQAMRDALMLNALGPDTAALSRLRAQSGTAKIQANACLLNTRKPKLHVHDRFGRCLAQDMAAALQTSHCTVANAFRELRLTGIGRGTLAGSTNFCRITDRAMLRQVA